MAYVPVEKIGYDEVLRQGTDKINKTIDAVNGAVVKVDGYEVELEAGIDEAKQIAADAGAEAVQIATDATASIEATANQANANSQTAINTANNAVSTANQNKQEFDQLRNDFDDLVAEAGDSNPEIVQARTDTTGIKQTTLANRLSVDFGDRMTKADGIEMLSGTTNVKKMMDFNGKTAGNTATNPHQGFSDFTAKALKKPADSWNEIGQSDYNKLASRDDSGVSTGSTSNGVIPQQLYKLNAVETVKTMAPQLFEGLDDEMAVQFVKDNFVSLVLTIRGKASSPNNKNLKVSMYVASADTWTTQIQGDATEYTDFTVQVNDVNYIGDDGFVYAIAYSDFTNGVTAASIDVDYVGVSVEVSMSSLDVLEKAGFATKTDLEPLAQQADLAAHLADTENPHGVTKSQVGLGDVSNYSVATEDEAKAGTADNKYMTPAKVAMFAQNLERKTHKIRIDTFNSDGSYFDGVTSISFADYWVNLKKITLLWGGYRPGEGGKSYGYRSIDYDKKTIERLSGVSIWEPMVAIATGTMSFKSYMFNTSTKTLAGNDSNKTDNNRNQTLKEVWVEVYV